MKERQWLAWGCPQGAGTLQTVQRRPQGTCFSAQWRARGWPRCPGAYVRPVAAWLAGERSPERRGSGEAQNQPTPACAPGSQRNVQTDQLGRAAWLTALAAADSSWADAREPGLLDSSQGSGASGTPVDKNLFEDRKETSLGQRGQQGQGMALRSCFSVLPLWFLEPLGEPF